MEGEIVFYDQADLDEWTPRPRALVAELVGDTTSPLGQLYDEWNKANQRARTAYAERNYEIWRNEHRGGNSWPQE